MAIVKMKRIRLIALAKDRDALLSSLLHVGCVEIREPEDNPAGEERDALLRRDASHLADARGDLTQLQHAIEVLGKYAPRKTSLFTPRAQLREADLLDEAARRAALEKAETINGHARTIGQLNARETRIHADRLALEPWSSCDVPLEQKGTAKTDILLGVIPATADFDAMAGALVEAAAADVRRLSADREQQYLEVIVHKDCRQEALDALRSFGFSFAQLKDLTGTVSENIRALGRELDDIARQRDAEIGAIVKMGPCVDELKTGLDRVEQVIATESAKERLLTGGSILYLEGWASVPEIPALEKALEKFDCAYELTEPAEEEYSQVPVELRNGRLVRPMNMVTDMYSLPAYGSVDPNPLMAPFFIVFYGMMMADMGYGLIMMILAAIVIWKAKPNGPTMRYMMPLMGLCGVSTFIWGALTGGFFGDLIPQIIRLFNPASTFELPALFSPLDDAVNVLIFSLVLGVIQVFTGMIVSMYMKFRRGQAMDALCNEGAWFLVFILAGVGYLIGQLVPCVIAALAVLVVAQGYGKKGFGIITGIFGSLYNGITGYFSDILSYSRLMALMLAGAVVAQVFNQLGAMTGNIVTFIIIALIGNALNFALNILGCYVHDMRLQCLEFFGRFYEDGGKPFRPLNINTKYVDVEK
ncbi:MAG: V-type ATP synthase subunit I [Oscillibacter sp.]|nr:V-type ATP synthase subunit I [Oscillibacter sp.]